MPLIHGFVYMRVTNMRAQCARKNGLLFSIKLAHTLKNDMP